jgi:hypothetical protein
MTDPTTFAKLVPGFEFLQGMMKNAGTQMPPMGQWIAPTIDPDELEKRIEQLKTVQFWLEQNAKMLAATIQALEVQRMTLSTLKTMNLPMADLTEALKVRVPPTPEPAPEPAPAPAAKKPSRPKSDAAPAPAAAAGAVDPMQWWGALTKQFGDLATQAMKDIATEPKTPASAPSKPAAKKPAPRRKR